MCLSFPLSLIHGPSFKAMRLKLCLQPLGLLVRALILGHVRLASVASEAIFWGRDESQKLLSDLRGHQRPKIWKIVIWPSLKDVHLFILQGPYLKGHLRPQPQSDLRSRLRPRPLSDLRGHLRSPNIAKIVIWPNLKDDHFLIFQGPHLKGHSRSRPLSDFRSHLRPCK